MTWNLWVDDQLDDPDQPWRHVPEQSSPEQSSPEQSSPEGWIGAKSVLGACRLVLRLGPPEMMDLDCDLGQGGRVITFVKWLEKHFHDTPPKWRMHSQNIVATPAVDSYMDSWHRSLKGYNSAQ